MQLRTKFQKPCFKQNFDFEFCQMPGKYLNKRFTSNPDFSIETLSNLVLIMVCYLNSQLNNAIKCIKFHCSTPRKVGQLQTK